MNNKYLKITIFLVLVLLLTSVNTITGDSKINDTKDNNTYLQKEDCGCLNIIQTDFSLNNNLREDFPVMTDPLTINEEYQYAKISDIPIISTPAEFSWIEHEGRDWTTPGKNQGNCGSCWDFAAIGALESVINIKENCAELNPDLSEQYVLSCLPAAANHYGRGCWGGNPYLAYYFIMNTTREGYNHNGIIYESCFPYEADHSIICTQKCSDWENQLVPIKNCSQIWFDPLNFDTQENREIIKSLIITNGPIASGINVTEDFSMFGLYNHKPTSYFKYRYEPWAYQINHIIVIVGWKDDPSIGNGGYWICKNSWGTHWGYNGFFNIEYGTIFTGQYLTWAEYDPDSYDWEPIPKIGGIYQSEIGQEIIFDASNSVDPEGEITSYLWNFGDGSTSNSVSPTHTYNQQGIYQVSLSVTDSSNKSSTVTTIAGINRNPINIEISGGNGFTIHIENPSDYDLIKKQLSINLQASLINGNLREKIIDIIPAHGEFQITTPFLGLGFGTITVSVENIAQTNMFLIIGPFILLW